MEEGSPDRASAESGTKRSSVSSGTRSRSHRRDFLRKFVDADIFTERLGDWFSANTKHIFEPPFDLTQIQNFDYALEGVSFHQLIRMPNAVYASTSDAVEATAYLAMEDFLHASAKSLWEAFWGEDGPYPFSVACLHRASLKFYPAEKAIAGGKLGNLCATAVMLDNTGQSHGKWGHILQLALLRPHVRSLAMDSETQPSLSVLGEAIFFALRMLLSRTLSRSNVLHNSNSVFMVLADSQYGGVVKVQGDVTNLDCDMNNIYGCAAEWIKEHSQISVSSVDRIWNKLGNANWGDIGALQVLMATFQCIAQFAGMPKHSVDDLAAHHGPRLQIRRTERKLEDGRGVGNGLFPFKQHSVSPEIVEVLDESKEAMKLEAGSVLWLEDSEWQRGFQINQVLSDGELHFYSAMPVEEPGRSLFLYVGSHPSQLEPALEDMNLWYQVQRQTKILTLMKQRGLSSKNLPQLVASGRIIHPGKCRKPSSGGNCDHPWCGTPILVTNPVGELVADLLTDGKFGSEEALRCCHDCLSALSTAASAGIRHGDIRPENVIRVSSGVRHPYYVLIGWGHAILEERDRPVMNLHFSSTYALQEGRLCSASDAESLVYLLFFTTSGAVPDLDSVEGALQWREASWSRRLIQQTLGDISPVLKAFADYVDSLCGTPYPMDYEIWLKRMRRRFHEEDHGKEVEVSDLSTVQITRTQWFDTAEVLTKLKLLDG
ncbi:hypothetical protein IFM89_016609 [Coptis chinensis]|uniref:NHR domain-containing protein n=1 Tax=Coptis chinensis TaxID=261450 RepID=A0A835M6K0_9MAGN|nr:hypothetical protein IFM89_016609 [Coptis chinensis]